MKKILFFLVALFGFCGSAMADDVAIDRSGWSITAYANPSSAIEGDADGRAAAAIDGKDATFFHSDWSGSQLGKGCPQAFQIEMAKEETINKISFLPRSNGAGAPLQYRIYVRNTSLDFSILTADNKAEKLSEETLGTPTCKGTWEDNATLKSASFTDATGKYILFIADDTHTTDAKWLCCAEFNAYYTDISDYETALDDAIKALDDLSVGTGIGQYDATKVNAAKTAAQTALNSSSRTIDSLTAAMTELENAIKAARNPFAAGTYKLKNKYFNRYARYDLESGQILTSTSDNAKSATYLFTFEPSDSNWKIKVSDGKYFKAISYWANVSVTDTESEYQVYEISFPEEDDVCFYMHQTIGGGYPPYEYINDNNSNNAGHVETSGLCDQSYWYAEVVSLETEQAFLKQLVDNVDNNIGTNPGQYTILDETAYQAAKALATNPAANVADVDNAIDNFSSLYSLNAITAGKIYRIENCYKDFPKTKALAAKGISTSNHTANTPAWKNADANDAFQYWTLKAGSTDGAFKAYNLFADKYISNVTATSKNEADACDITFTSIGSAQFNIFFAAGSKPTTAIHCNGWGWTTDEDRQENLTQWGGSIDSPSAWKLIEVTSADELAAIDATMNVVLAAQPIEIADGATVISPTEFAAPAIVNEAITNIKAVAGGTVEEKSAAYETNAETILNYLNAIKNYGALINIPYTSVKGWNSIILPVNWSCPDGWYRFSCDTLVVDTNKLAVASSGGTKNTPMLVYDNNGGKYQFIGYSTGAGTENVTNGWLVGVLESENNMTSTEEGKTAYVIDAENQTITKADAATAVDLYHCYILADEVLDYATLLFPSCDKSALLAAIEAATPYSTLIGEGVGKYTDANDLPAKLQEANTLNESINDDSYLHQADIDAKTAALNSARNSLTINQPVVGKYYRIRENKTESQYYLTCRNDSPRLTKYGVADANNIFYLDEGKTLLSYSKGLYVTAKDSLDTTGNGCSAVTLKDADAEGDKFEFNKTNIAGNYGIKDVTAGKYLYHWEWNGNNVIVLTDNANDSRCQMLLEEVTTLPRSLNLVGDFYYGTFYAPVAVEHGDDVTCYTIEVGENNFTLNELTGVIPANTGVILKATAQNVEFNIVASDATAPEQALTGTIKTTAKKNATNPYVFGAKNGALGLYKYSGETLAGHKAYYDAPETASESNFRLDFGTVTSIAEAIEAAEQGAALYDLSGRQIKAASNGIYIKNGKKHIVK